MFARPHRSPMEEQLTRIGISSIHEIAATHRLPYHQGKCYRTHGHNYRITFRKFGTPADLTRKYPVGEPPPSDLGMLMDFGDFDTQIKAVLSLLDHWPLNDDLRLEEQRRLNQGEVVLLGLPNPTAEHLALWLLEQLPGVDEVEVWETGKHSATATRPRVLIPPQLQQQLTSLIGAFGRVVSHWLSSPSDAEGSGDDADGD